MWLGYLFRFDNLLFELMLLMVNIVFYSMEMKFILCKNLKLIVGEIGPVEIELIISTILVLGSYFGAAVF